MVAAAPMATWHSSCTLRPSKSRPRSLKMERSGCSRRPCTTSMPSPVITSRAPCRVGGQGGGCRSWGRPAESLAWFHPIPGSVQSQVPAHGFPHLVPPTIPSPSRACLIPDVKPELELQELSQQVRDALLRGAQQHGAQRQADKQLAAGENRKSPRRAQRRRGGSVPGVAGAAAVAGSLRVERVWRGSAGAPARGLVPLPCDWQGALPAHVHVPVHPGQPSPRTCTSRLSTSARPT